MEEAEEEPLFAERVAGIDIGKAAVMVTIRVPGDTRQGGRQQETREFGPPARTCWRWRTGCAAGGWTKAGMEATGDYWKPVYFLLEQQGFDCVLYHAAQVKALPGRPKTDKLDSVWLAKITERGSLPSSFVPPEDIRRLRTHTRYRGHLVQARTAEKERCEKLLEDAHLKLSSVISDVHGVAGRAMLKAIIAGSATRGPWRSWPGPDARQAPPAGRGPGLLVLHPRARLRPGDDARQHRPPHRPGRRADRQDRGLCEPYARQVAQLDAIPGFGVITAQDIIAETGADMTVFPTAGHLCSWARAGAPGQRVRRQAQGQERHRPRQSLHRRRARRGRLQRRPHPDLPGRQVPAAGAGTCPRRKPRAPS